MEKVQKSSNTLCLIFVCEKWERIRKEECKSEKDHGSFIKLQIAFFFLKDGQVVTVWRDPQWRIGAKEQADYLKRTAIKGPYLITP